MSLFKTDPRRYRREKFARWKSANPVKWKIIHDRANKKYNGKKA